MNPDDRLRQALHDEADQIEPADDGWERIQSWTAAADRRTRVRRAGLVGLAAVAMVAIVVGAVALTGDDGQRLEVQRPVGSTSTEPTQPDKTPLTTTNTPPTSSAPAEGDPSAVVWPVGESSYTDPSEAALAFMRDYVGMPNPVAAGVEPFEDRGASVEVRPRADLEALTTFVTLAKADSGRWWVVNAENSNIVVASPLPRDEVSSPVTVTGRASAFEGNVLVEVRQDGQEAGGNLGQAPVTGSGSQELGRFKGNIEFSTPSTQYGALVLTTHSAEDGSVQQATVRRVRFAPPANESCSPPVPEGRTVKVFLLCEEQSVAAAERSIGDRQDVLRAALEFLLAGPTPEEDAVGLFSLFSEKTAGMLADVTIRSDGTAVVDLDSEIKAGLPTVGSSAGSGAFIRQLNATVFQFENVQRVEYLLDGSCEAFWEWHQAACGDNSPVTRESAEG